MTRTALISTLGLLLLLGPLGPGCGGEESQTIEPPTPTTPDDYGKVIRSQKQRESGANVPSAELQQLASGNAEFAWTLYHQLGSQSQDNLFYSPLSISQALAMAYAGARANTEKQMAETLHFNLPQQRLHPAFNALDLELASRGQGAEGMDGQGFRLRVVNALWGQDGYGFLEGYLDTLAQYYGAGMRAVDFHKATETARQMINAWVAKETEHKIPELLQQGILDSLTRLVLTNVVYFNAAWDKTFALEMSGTGPFQLLDGSTVKVPTMGQVETLPYASGDGYQAVELPYDGKELSMVIVVPDAGRFAEVEGQLGPELMGKAIAALTPQMLSLTLPKWKVESSFSLKRELEALGMTDAFSLALADFSGIHGGVEPLYISSVIHKAYVSVNEQGTEATAATAVVMSGGAMPQQLTVDRPFIFVIRDIATDSILFVGRVTNPLG